MTKTELLQRWFDEVWFRGNLDAIGELFVPNAEANGVLPEIEFGPDEFRELVKVMREHLGNIRVTLHKTIEQDDWLAALTRAQMTRIDNHAPIEMTGQVMARFDGDKMVETYNQFDLVSLFEQMEQFPQHTLPICMTGARLTWA